MCKYICINTLMKMKKICIPLCQTYQPTAIKTDFQKVDQYTRDKWLISGTTHDTDNQ